ncbi:hypothetical protein HNV08_14300 [Winogradskyella eckloniae]|uniref:hypothetical protein n=1 Tax=Winogradskyella eckloniae TaxID=1089306 RepID=UPI001563BD59|nr:hypothetical protein [Winogradskyella eckloniae]NRD21226.1 hypothetical protein [Winogradskyella eckloniae]
MKTVLSLLCLLSLLSCIPEPEVRNDQETLKTIFAENQYRIKVETCGCFGCGTYIFNVDKIGDIATISNASGTEKIEVINDSLDSFKYFMSERIGQTIGKDMPLCTSSYQFQVDNGKFAVTFSDEICSEWDKLNDIIALKSIPDSMDY